MEKILAASYKFILNNHIFISLCAVALSMETAILLHEPFRAFSFYGFIFSGTLFTYNSYYLQDELHPNALRFTIIGFAAALLFYFTIDFMSFYHLIFIAILSLFYILPGYIGYKSAPFYLVFKLFILVIVWTHVSFFLPLQSIKLNLETYTYYAYRFMLMWNLCLLFFIKDEEGKFNISYLNIIFAMTLAVQLLLALIIFYNFSHLIGIVFIAISLLLSLLTYLFIRNKKTQTDYLFYIDGIMLLESIFVLLVFKLC